MARVERRNMLRNLGVIVVSVTTIAFVFQLAGAGDLFPSSAPSGTMASVGDVYDVLVGSFDSSSITASKSGSALNVSRCIIEQLQGNTCP